MDFWLKYGLQFILSQVHFTYKLKIYGKSNLGNEEDKYTQSHFINIRKYFKPIENIGLNHDPFSNLSLWLPWISLSSGNWWNNLIMLSN